MKILFGLFKKTPHYRVFAQIPFGGASGNRTISRLEAAIKLYMSKTQFVIYGSYYDNKKEH